MNFGVFESAVSDGYEDRAQKNKVSKALDKASKESVEKVGEFIFEATSKKDLEDRLALCENDIREICSSYLKASNAYVAVRGHLIERHADHWRSNPDFLHHLVEMYGTIEVSDQQLIEALEEFSSMTPQVVPEEGFEEPELQRLSTTKLAYGSLDDYYEENSGVDETLRGEALSWTSSKKTGRVKVAEDAGGNKDYSTENKNPVSPYSLEDFKGVIQSFTDSAKEGGLGKRIIPFKSGPGEPPIEGTFSLVDWEVEAGRRFWDFDLVVNGELGRYTHVTDSRVKEISLSDATRFVLVSAEDALGNRHFRERPRDFFVDGGGLSSVGIEDETYAFSRKTQFATPTPPPIVGAELEEETRKVREKNESLVDTQYARNRVLKQFSEEILGLPYDEETGVSKETPETSDDTTKDPENTAETPEASGEGGKKEKGETVKGTDKSGEEYEGTVVQMIFGRPKIKTEDGKEIVLTKWSTKDPVDRKIADKYLKGRRQRVASSWRLDTPLNAYISSSAGSFSCHCGARLEIPGYHNCKCGKIWNGYKISAKDKEVFVVREVPVRDGVVLAKRKTASTVGDVLKSFGWKPVDTAQEDWESPRGQVTFFGVQELIMAWGPEDNDPSVEEDTSNMTTGDIVKRLMELASYYG